MELPGVCRSYGLYFVMLLAESSDQDMAHWSGASLSDCCADILGEYELVASATASDASTTSFVYLTITDLPARMTFSRSRQIT